MTHIEETHEYFEDRFQQLLIVLEQDLITDQRVLRCIRQQKSSTCGIIHALNE